MTTKSLDPDGIWYVTDRSLKNSEGDKFAAEDIAAQLEDIVTSIIPPATIGLIGGFGVGKTSITNMLQDRMKGHADFQVVSLSADRHTGVAKQRAILYGFAEALVQDAKVDKASVSASLERVDHDVITTGAELDKYPFKTYLSEHRDRLRKIVLAVLAFAAGIYLVGVIIAGLVAGADWSKSGVWVWPTRLLPVVVGVGAVIGVVELIPAWLKTALTPNSIERRRNRVEAADELERVFGVLADLCPKTLVVVVDDIDRLSSSDVLEALASVKTFQAIPKRRIIFVLSCDDRTIRQALVDATPGLSKVNGDLELAAEEYLNKLFVVRQVLPPFRTTDLRDFASSILDAGHAGKVALGESTEDVLDVLLHDGVRDPRHVIRLINAFFSNYRLAAIREQRGDLPKAEVTGQPRLLARLTTLQIDFPSTFDAIAAEFSVLPLLDALLLGEVLNDEQLEVLHNALSPESDEPTVQSLAESLELALQDYLLRTVRSVPRSYSLEPFIYFGQTAAGKILGSERADQVRQSLANRQPKALLERFAEGGAVAEAAVDHALESLKRARPGLPQNNTVAAIAEALLSAPVPKQRGLADALATAITVGATPPGPRDLATLLRTADASYAPVLTRHLVNLTDSEVSPEAGEERALVLAELALEVPTRTEVVDALGTYFHSLPDRCGWEVVPRWLELFDHAPADQRDLVVGGSFFTAMATLAIGAPAGATAQVTGPATRLYSSPSAGNPPVVDALDRCLRAEAAEPRSFALAALTNFMMPSESAAEVVDALAESLTDATTPIDGRAVATLSMIERICATYPGAMSAENEIGVTVMAALAGVAPLNPVEVASAFGPVVGAFQVDSAPVAVALAAVVAQHLSVDDEIGVMTRDALLVSLNEAPQIDGTVLMASMLGGIGLATAPHAAEAGFSLDTLECFFQSGLPTDFLQGEIVRWHSELTTTTPAPGFVTLAAALGRAHREGLVSVDLADSVLTRMAALNASAVAHRPLATEVLTWFEWPAGQRMQATTEIGSCFDELSPAARIEAIQRISEWPNLEESQIDTSLQDRLVAELTSDDAEAATLDSALALCPGLASSRRSHLIALLLESRPELAAAGATLDVSAGSELLRDISGSPSFTLAVDSLNAQVRPQAVDRFVRASFDEGSAVWNDDSVRLAVGSLSNDDAAGLLPAAMDALNGGSTSAIRGAYLLSVLANRQPPVRPDTEALVSRALQLLDPSDPPSEELAQSLGACTAWIDAHRFQAQVKALRKTKEGPQVHAADAFERGRKL